MHVPVYEWVRECVKREGPFRSIIEIGSRNINGSIRSEFAEPESYVGIDLYEGPDVDWVGDAAEYQPDELVDAVVCCEVLEHTPNADQLLAVAWQWLKPTGVLIVTAATDPRAPHSALDQKPIRPDEFYRNVSREMLNGWLHDAGFVGTVVDIAGADIRACAFPLGLSGHWS